MYASLPLSQLLFLWCYVSLSSCTVVLKKGGSAVTSWVKTSISFMFLRPQQFYTVSARLFSVTLPSERFEAILSIRDRSIHKSRAGFRHLCNSQYPCNTAEESNVCRGPLHIIHLRVDRNYNREDIWLFPHLH